jgi:hypothetical protein
LGGYADLKHVASETLNFPPTLVGKAGWFHTSREKLKLGFKASPPVGERFGEREKGWTQNEKSRLMYFSFFV